MKQYVLLLDLKDDPALIAEYEAYHKNVWPEVVQSISDAGIKNMEIFRYANRLVMIVEAGENFSFEAKALSDEKNERVKAWEQLMWKYQQALPGAVPGEKWKEMERMFSLSS